MLCKFLGKGSMLKQSNLPSKTMQKLAVVVLNYNDFQNTTAQVERIRNYSCINYIIVVDNCSTDGSGKSIEERLHLWNKEEDKVLLVFAKKNGGYGAGNNLGMKKALNLGMTHILIANPDTVFTEDCLEKMLHVYAENEKLGALSVTMLDSQLGLQQTAWPLRNFYGELLNSGPISRRLFKRILNYSSSYLSPIPKEKIQENDSRDGISDVKIIPLSERRKQMARKKIGKGFIPVGALHGSMLMMSSEAFQKTGGFDEKVFLYCEENILGKRLRNAGFVSGLIPELQYLHENGGSTKKIYSRMLPKQKIRQKSERYYYKNYLNIGTFQEIIALLFQAVVLLETSMLDMVMERKKG